MNHLPYRAIALDLDGTLTNHDKVVTPKTREALLQAEAEGVVIILASGRPTYGIEPVAECLELDKRGGYILSYNGGNSAERHSGLRVPAYHLYRQGRQIHELARRHRLQPRRQQDHHRGSVAGQRQAGQRQRMGAAGDGVEHVHR